MKKFRVFWIFLVLCLLLGGLLYKYQNSFVNTTFFFALVTFLVGSFALFVFIKQEADEKSNAATAILLEVRNAESKVEKIVDKLDQKNNTDFPSVLSTNSWRKYSHLFVKDLDLDHVQLLNNFYFSCEVIEDLVTRQNNFFWITTEERAKIVQRKLAEFYDDFQKESLTEATPPAGQITLTQKKFNWRKESLEKFYVNEPLTYAPEKTLSGLEFQTRNLKLITSTPCGEKLKELAHLNK